MQLPLMLAFAVTIHKSRGITLDLIRIALGKSEQNFGVAFVALSRILIMHLIDNYLLAYYITKRKMSR
jgi:hypothetical protein